jgi:hypothetical protein
VSAPFADPRRQYGPMTGRGLSDIEILRSYPRFTGRWLYIEHKDVTRTDVIRLNRPTSFQRQIARAALDPVVRRIVVCKSRQVFISTLAASIAFYQACKSKGPFRVLVPTDCQDTTDALMRKYYVFADNLPPRIKSQLRITFNYNKNEVRFGVNGSVIKMVTMRGASLAKGFTYLGYVAEEVGFWKDDKNAWASATAAVSPSALKWTISTPNGPGNLFHDQVIGAKKADRIDGDPATRFFFQPWYEHHEYTLRPRKGWEPTQECVDLMKLYGYDLDRAYWRWDKIYGADAIGADSFRKYYPATDAEGFLSFDGKWFDIEYLHEEIAYYELTSNKKGKARIYHKPRTGHTYAIGVDPSFCNGGHYAVACVIEDTGRVVAVYSTRTGGVEQFSRKVALLAARYNDALVLVERNPGGGGYTVIKNLIGEGCSLWRDDKRAFWWTSHQSKEMAYLNARRIINQWGMDCPDLQTLDELTRIREENGRIANHSKTKKEDKDMDDHADAYVLAEWCRRSLPTAEHIKKRGRKRVTKPSTEDLINQALNHINRR